ncbi:hypothetical protein PCH_Pc20g07190 [Penicillium rubens Wisconsin 54-1255]|uniref:CCHC-type domain-containing protein n=1 Tax=Penicillium rubens (strain ATCC 28089 / DSM 1075 / NRRL 1951 / Wisconsin 54-1255) TaxID=500485 RepID=B6HDI9_PENRW|nr:hypothetical protein PCH_Pc20g07190 [Penicillium rubens Wisconsin 54-1255]
MDLVVTLVVLVELTKELLVTIDNSITTETNNTSTKANTTTSPESVLGDIPTAFDIFHLLILSFNAPLSYCIRQCENEPFPSKTDKENNVVQSSATLTCYLCRDPRHLQRSCPLLALWRSAIETLCRVQNIPQLKLFGSLLTRYP